MALPLLTADQSLGPAIGTYTCAVSGAAGLDTTNPIVPQAGGENRSFVNYGALTIALVGALITAIGTGAEDKTTTIIGTVVGIGGIVGQLGVEWVNIRNRRSSPSQAVIVDSSGNQPVIIPAPATPVQPDPATPVPLYPATPVPLYPATPVQYNVYGYHVESVNYYGPQIPQVGGSTSQAVIEDDYFSVV